MSHNFEELKDRKVGTEAQGTYLEKLKNGFFDKYMSGNGLDVGFAGYEEGCEPILPTAIGIDIDYPDYDGINLPFDDFSQDYVFSSHCLEHIEDYKTVIREWFRVLKIGGFLIISVPHQFLYEKKKDLPSKWNLDHKRFYTPSSLLREIDESLEPNSYRIRSLRDNDDKFDYSIPPEKHSGGRYEIELVVEKTEKPNWEIL